MRSSDVVLTVPADASFVSLVRTAATAVCAQADFPVDTLDDVRLAVDEACALTIADAPEGADLTVGFTVESNTVHIELSAPSTSGRAVRTTTFAWTVLTALVDRVETEVRDGRLTIRLHAHGITSVAS
ncbi:MAG: ATP-binding protein [Candidatus Nanopelagicales bacterium]